MAFPVALGMLAASIASGIAQNAASKKAQKKQVQQAKELNEHNRQLAMKTWEETNFAEQRKQMEKAGLNIGMMYGGTQSGGTTQGGGTQMPEAAPNVPGYDTMGMGLQLGLQAKMQEAQIKNIEADTNLKDTQAGKTAGVDTKAVETGIEEAMTRIEKLKADTKNVAITTELQEYQRDIAKIQRRIADETQDEAIRQLTLANNEAQQDIRKKKVEGDVGEATKSDIIKQVRTATIEQALRIMNAKMDLKIKDTGIVKMAQEVTNMIDANKQNWEKLNQNEREIEIKKALKDVAEKNSEFSSGQQAENIRMIDALMRMIKAMQID